MLTNRFPAFKSRSFVIFFIGQFFSLVGTWMQATVQPYLAYKITEQPFYLGLLGFAATIPALLFTLPGGVIIEQLDKRKTVIAMQVVMMVQALILAFLTLAGIVTIWHMVILAFILGTANVLEITARQSMLIELVGREALPNAIALNSSLFNAARVIGPALSVPFLLFLKGSGEGWAFFANGVSYLFVIIGLLFVQTQPLTVKSKGVRFSKGQMLDGLRYIRQDKIILTLVIFVGVLSIFGIPFSQQIPVFARDVLSTPLDTADSIEARNSLMVSLQGVGALIASGLLAMFSTYRRKGWVLTAGQFVFSVALIGLSITSRAEIAYILMPFAGWGMISHMALTNTLIQQSVPDELRGRVISTYLWVLQGATPLGSLLIGFVAQAFGAPVAVFLGGSVCLILYLIIHIKNPSIRDIQA